VAISSFYGLQTSLRGLLAQQRLLDTTGHNIANASTQGYSRQEAVLQASPALLVPSGTATGAGAHLGSGVDVSSYRRVRDGFIDLQYRIQNTGQEEWRTRSQALDRAEAALSEPGDNGINTQLSRFWDAWGDLANAPADPAAKQALVEQAQSLGDAFATIRAQIKLVQDQSAAQYADLTRPATATDPGGEIAQTASEIAQLNDTIRRYITAGDSPNDLMDRRDLLLDKLSGYGQIQVSPGTDAGTIKVTFAAGSVPIVDGPASQWTGPPAGAWNPGGTLGGLLKVADPNPAVGTLAGFVQELDKVAETLATKVNAAYAGTFFDATTSAASLQVNAALASNPLSVTAGTGGAGSNNIALDVAALRTQPPTIGGAYGAFVARVGAEVKAADRQATNAQALTEAVENRRQSVAGVSMDEEMANLVRFQRGYQASARAMSAMDEMLDVLVNRTGRVGL
jgi:flagellar hook-associated protein 1 FlgK